MPTPNQHHLQSLYAEHRHLEMLFDAIDSASGAQAPARLYRLLHAALSGHIEADRSLLYGAAAARGRPPESGAMRRCEQGVEDLEILAQAVAHQRAGSAAWRAWLQALRRAYRHHVEQDEQQLFAPAEERVGGVGSKAVGRTGSSGGVRGSQRQSPAPRRPGPRLTLVRRAPGPAA